MAKITSRKAPQDKNTRRPRTAHKKPKIIAFVASHSASKPAEPSSTGPLASSSTDQVAAPKSPAQNKHIVRVYHKENAPRMTRQAVRESGAPLFSQCLYCNAIVRENVRSTAHLPSCPLYERPVVARHRQAQLRPIFYCK